MSNEILTEIKLQLDQFRADLKAAQDEAAKAGKKSGQSLGDGVEDGLNKAAGKLKATFLAIGGAVAGAFALHKVIDQASEQESAIHSLNAALALNGKYTDEASAHFLAYADTLAKSTTAANDAVVKGGATLAQFGKLTGDQLERATKAALDFSATGRVGLEEAFQLIAKAADGNVAALGRYGVKIHSTGDEAQDFARALKELEDRFGGLAQVQTNTFAGALEQSKNAFSEVLEAIGMLIIKSPTMIKAIHVITDAFNNAVEAIQEWGDGRDVINEMLQGLVSLGKAANTYLVVPFELAFNVLNLGFEALKTSIQAVIYGLAFSLEKVTGVLAPFSSKMAEINSGLQDFVASSGATLDEFAAKTTAANDKLFDFNVAAKVDEYTTKIGDWAAAVTPVVETNFADMSAKAMAAQQPALLSGWEFMVNGFNAAFGKVKLQSEEFRAQLQGKINSAFTNFRDGVAHSFASIGDALVKGKNAFLAFGQAILGVFGDLAIQLGTFYFLLGLANLFLNPAAAAAEIAGGLALIVLGGALKAFAQTSGNGLATGGGGAAAGAESGGGVAATQNLATEAPDHFNENRRGESTKVEIHVQGNILDRRQTGLELAEVINEAFGSNGVTYATGAGS